MSIEDLVSRLLLVPAEPKPPLGSRVLNVFRAAPNFFKYNMVIWLTGQLLALAGLIVALVFVTRVSTGESGGVFGILQFMEVVAWVGFIVQVPLTFFMRRLDYRLRWYIVTDRSLRIREGIATVKERTMTFANIQNISVHQGPIQRLLGIADVEVKSAGGGEGGSPAAKQGHAGEDLHSAKFRGVDNASEIRDLIKAQVRKHRDSGLGDPDDISAAPLAVSDFRPDPAAGPAARLLLMEVRRLREVFRVAGRNSSD